MILTSPCMITPSLKMLRVMAEFNLTLGKNSEGHNNAPASILLGEFTMILRDMPEIITLGHQHVAPPIRGL
jgi:hypothetical protein